MSFTDRQLQCADCGATFDFTAGEQEFYATKGFTNDPKRCPQCRTARKSNRSGSGRQQRMFGVICAQCGIETEVPFEPREDRPVYCRECYAATASANRP